ncbi:MAG: 2-C-methyl-D-erythritol 2,4-cyclodiphosphate synthase [Chloroflexi bacterium]|nr:2-C-methyl-D-erythritol 2,4-cyclodiphosphate synthase [Chloroflexota bacterium]
MSSRSGLGFDVHPLVEGRPLVLGGVTVPFEKGLSGHSDGDVLTHAIIDALLGAAGLDDIGTHFPSSDERYRGIASTLLLRETVEILTRHRWHATYVDATIIAERPVLRPFMGHIKQTLSAALGLDASSVNLKAKTTDRLGFIGRGEGIASMAIATVEQFS